MSTERMFIHQRQHDALSLPTAQRYLEQGTTTEQAWLNQQLREKNWLSLHRHLVEGFLGSPVLDLFPEHQGKIPLTHSRILPSLARATLQLPTANRYLYEIGIDARLVGPTTVTQGDEGFFYQQGESGPLIKVTPETDTVFWQARLTHTPSGAYYPWFDPSEICGLFLSVAVSFNPRTTTDPLREITLLDCFFTHETGGEAFPYKPYQIVREMIQAGGPYIQPS